MPLFPTAPPGANVKLVDTIPTECGLRMRRRPTVGTEETERSCSEDELSEIVVAVVEEDSSAETDSVDPRITSCRPCCSTPPLAEPPELELSDDGMIDLSAEKLLLRNGTNTRLAALLEENNCTLQALLGDKDGELFYTPRGEEEDSSSSSSASACSPPLTKICSTTNQETWKETRQFELKQSLPGVAAMILYATAHASNYELISNLVFEGVELVEFCPKWILYTGMLLSGCVLARASGLVWHFTGPLAYKRVKWDYHNRIRLGAVDARWLHWLQEQGEVVLGVVHVIAYYLCYIAVVYFVGQLAIYCDQREEFLEDMPSVLYQEELAERMEEDPIDTSTFLCPARDYSPRGLFESYNRTSAWDPTGCGNDLVIFGPEDEEYFFEVLSKNSNENFLGQEYEIPMFDTPHQLFFYATLTATSVVLMKTAFGFSFWSGW